MTGLCLLRAWDEGGAGPVGEEWEAAGPGAPAGERGTLDCRCNQYGSTGQMDHGGASSNASRTAHWSVRPSHDVGIEHASPVSRDYGPHNNAFTGTVNWVQMGLEKDDHDHLISPDKRFKLAMARR